MFKPQHRQERSLSTEPKEALKNCQHKRGNIYILGTFQDKSLSHYFCHYLYIYLSHYAYNVAYTCYLQTKILDTKNYSDTNILQPNIFLFFIFKRFSNKRLSKVDQKLGGRSIIGGGEGEEKEQIIVQPSVLILS